MAPGQKTSTSAINLFFSYSHKDEALRGQLETHLSLLKRQGIIDAWHDRQIGAGREWAGEIDERLKSARIILLLISPDFLASDYCYDVELTDALARHESGEARVIPVILRPVDWYDAPFAKLQALPKNAKPVATWSNIDEAFLDITQGIRVAAQELMRIAVVTDKAEVQAAGLDRPVIHPGSGFIPKSPYRGLFAFDEGFRRFFFGREKAIQEIFAHLQQKRILAVLGSSGSGKTSLVLAGLLPLLRQDESNIIIKFRPREEPLLSLSIALIEELEKNKSKVERLKEAQKLSAVLGGREIKLRTVVDKIMDESVHRNQLIIVVDQFEEIFSMCKHDETRHSFVAGLQEIEDISKLILTLRADFMGQVVNIRSLADRLQGNQYNLGPLYPEEMKRVIKNPAEIQGVEFEVGLVERIVDEIGLSPRPGMLPLLEFALTLLWDEQSDRHITHKAYDMIGGVKGALIRHVEELYKNLSQEEKIRLKNIMFQLVRPVGGLDYIRRIASREEFDEQQWSLVQKLVDARLLTTDRDALGKKTVELVHEALIEGWERLKNWMNEEHSFIVWKERMRALLPPGDDKDLLSDLTLPRHMMEEAKKWLSERPDDIGDTIKTIIANTEREIRDLEKKHREAVEGEIEKIEKKPKEKITAELPASVEIRGSSVESRGNMIPKLQAAFKKIFPGREKTLFSNTFQHYASKKIVERLLKDPASLKLGGEMRYLTVLSFEVGSFTSLSETMSPSDLVRFVNVYLTEICKIITRVDGYVDRFQDGGLIAEFGIPIYFDDHALKACRAAIETQNWLKTFDSGKYVPGAPSLWARIGISSGNVIVGNMGSAEIFNYTVAGDSANLANGLSGANRVFGTKTIMSEDTYNLVKQKIVARSLDFLRVKGRSRPVQIFEVVARKEEQIPEEQARLISLFEEGLTHYHNRHWEKARKLFEASLALNPADGPSKVYLGRVSEYISNPPPDDWDGVFRLI